MNAKASVPVRTRLLAAAAALAIFAFGPSATADTVRINFSGSVGSGYADLTLGPAAAGDTVDASKPPMAITAASGRFNGTTITGVLGLHPTPPPAGETLIPASYSLFAIAGYGDHGGVTYDNLFYRSGSPQICWIVDGEHPDGYFAFPFSGGMFDLLGVMFTLQDGSVLDLWSFGIADPTVIDPETGNPYLPPFVSGLTYGLKLIVPDPTAEGGYDVRPGLPFATASIPEPGLVWLFGAAIVGAFAWRRSREARKGLRKSLH